MSEIPPVILVSDPLAEDPLASWGVFDRRHDRPWRSSVEKLAEALGRVAPHVTVQTDLAEFVRQIPKYHGHLVVPYWFGEASRNRHGYVPAICESAGLNYVGPDAYSKIICSDKTLSKSLCSQVGLATPSAVLVHGVDDISLIPHSIGPVVVKPNGEGCSLGIDQTGPISSRKQVVEHVEKILDKLGGPVLVEEFVPGREVSICLMGASEPRYLRAVSWRIQGDEEYLDNRLFTADLKAHALSIEPMHVAVGDDLGERCSRLFRILDKVEILRVDGRLRRTDGRFVAFELTTDVDLSPGGEFSLLYAIGGRAYDDFVRDLILNALERRG